MSQAILVNCDIPDMRRYIVSSLSDFDRICPTDRYAGELYYNQARLHIKDDIKTFIYKTNYNDALQREHVICDIVSKTDVPQKNTMFMSRLYFDIMLDYEDIFNRLRKCAA